MKYLFLILIGISGCATTDIAQIERDFKIFVEDCRVTDGELVIDKRLIDRRVQNAPITPWEMKDAVCFYDDGTY